MKVSNVETYGNCNNAENYKFHKSMNVDLCVYGGTSGGVVAAIAARQQGRTVVLIEPGRHLGGMSSGGLGLTDHGWPDAIGGFSREFYQRIAEHYRLSKTSDSEHVQGIGWTHEPHVAEDIFNDWVKAYSVNVVFDHRLANVVVTEGVIRSIILDYAPSDERGAPASKALKIDALHVNALMFIDASYEGDLMAGANIHYTTRRESREQYDESLAGCRSRSYSVMIDPYVQPGHPQSGLLPLVQANSEAFNGAASNEIQAYNFRLCMSQTNMHVVTPPLNYDPWTYELFGREIKTYIEMGKPLLPHQFYHPPAGQPWIHPRMLKMSPLPNGKNDVNNSDEGTTDFIGGGSTLYPEADWALRAKIWHNHEDYIRGLLYFLRTDKRVLPETRDEVAKWGLPNDEFTDTNGWPHQLYIRESRRMLGAHVMIQADCESPTIQDSIGLGSYPLDSHNCQRLACDDRIFYEGSFFSEVPIPYPISYRSICPCYEECRNLLVICCLSSSHVAYSSMRMEPVIMILGQSAAIAACQAIEQQVSVQHIDINSLQSRLRSAGQILNWSDVCSQNIES